MSISRIYQADDFKLNQAVMLDEKASHHLARVLRANVGDQLTIFNGRGGEFKAVIARIDKKGVLVEPREFLPRDVESSLTICLAQGIARGEKMDFIVQKAVELGAATVMPLITERCNVRLEGEREEKRLQHWQAVAVSACEQSGRNRVPAILAPMRFKDWLATIKAEYRFVLSPHVKNKLIVDNVPLNADILLLIGPEGGLSDQEVQLAEQHGFIPLQLGPRVLRTETATIAALTAIQLRYGDMG